MPRAVMALVADETEYARLVAAVYAGGGTADLDVDFGGRATDSCERAPNQEDRLVRALATSYLAARAALPGIPGAYRSSEEWRRHLDEGWSRYREAIEKGRMDELAGLLRNFFRNEGVAGFWAHRDVFRSFARLRGAAALFSAGQMMRQYLVWREFCPDASLLELDAPRIGNPWGYRFGEALVYQPAFEYHFQARHFRRMLAALRQPVVLEIGGGFGGLACHLLRCLPGVKYLGFDLPENILIQGYYLSAAFPEARILLYREGQESLGRSVFDDYDVVLMPNFMLPKTEEAMADLVVNVRSLSEMGAETIAEYFRQISRLCRRFFFHENLCGSRYDGLHGITCDRFPALEGFARVAANESRWPKFQRDSAYPCREELFLRTAGPRGNCAVDGT